MRPLRLRRLAYWLTKALRWGPRLAGWVYVDRWDVCGEPGHWFYGLRVTLIGRGIRYRLELSETTLDGYLTRMMGARHQARAAVRVMKRAAKLRDIQRKRRGKMQPKMLTRELSRARHKAMKRAIRAQERQAGTRTPDEGVRRAFGKRRYMISAGGTVVRRRQADIMRPSFFRRLAATIRGRRAA